jgi:hypothetical protein
MTNNIKSGTAIAFFIGPPVVYEPQLASLRGRAVPTVLHK